MKNGDTIIITNVSISQKILNMYSLGDIFTVKLFESDGTIYGYNENYEHVRINKDDYKLLTKGDAE